MSAPGKLGRSSRWKTGPSKGQRPRGNNIMTFLRGCPAAIVAAEPGGA
jgi:hypothetical protein